MDYMAKEKETDLRYKMLTNAVEQTADHVMITDKDGRIEYVNPAFEKTTGFRQNEALGKTPKILQSGQQTQKYYQELWDTILSGKVFHAHTINKKKNGKSYVADQTISPIINESGDITHFVSVWKDITEKVQLEERLKNERQKLEEIIGFDEKISAIRKSDRLMDFVVFKIGKILEAGKCSIWLIDGETKEMCIKASQGFEEHEPICVKINQSVVGRVVESGQPILVQDVDGDPQLKQFHDISSFGRSFMVVPIKLDDNTIGVICAAEKFTLPFQETIFNETDLKILLMMAREVAVAIENVKFYKELQFLTITDPLTNIHNFRHFAKTLDYEIKRLKRFPGNLALMMMDIDGFKSYNDQFGHLAGDQLLKEIGQIIQKNLRDVDVVCRYAGDEFVVILPGTDSAGSSVVAEKLRKVIAETKFKKPVTASIGVAQHKKGMNRHELTSKADRALYEAKHKGKNKVCIFG